MNLFILISLALVVVASIFGFKFYFSRNSKKLLKSKSDADFIFVKKHASVDVHKHRPWFYRTAILLAISSTLVAFNFKSKAVRVIEEPPIKIEEGILVIPPTRHEPPKKAAPPKPEPEVVTYEEVEEEVPEEKQEEKKEEFIELPTEVTIETVLGKEKEKVEEEEKPIEEPEVFKIVEQMPSYPGGDKALFKFLSRNIEYPRLAKEQQREGVVYISFVVMEDGSIADAKITSDIGMGCGKEALRVVKRMPNWKPGKQRGKKVRVLYNLPVMYKLN